MLPTGIFICCTVPSEAVPFVYLASVCRSLQCLISALTQWTEVVSCLGSLVQSCCGEGGALQTNVTGLCGEHSQCSGHTGFNPAHGCVLSYLHCSGSRLLYMERALRCAWFQPSGAPQKRGTKSCACVLCLPRLSGSAARSLTGALSPGAARLLPSASPATAPAAGRVPAPCVSPRPSRQMSPIQNLRRSLIRNWRPVCSAVGLRSLGPSLPLSPPPCPLPPAGLGRSAAG